MTFTAKMCTCAEDGRHGREGHRLCAGAEQAAAWGCLCQEETRKELAGSRLLLEPLQPILKQRGKEYGDYVEMCARIQAIKDGMCLHRRDGQPHLHTMQVEALEMIATKIGRILTGNPDNEDSWRDIAGYATLVADRILQACGGEIVKIPHGWTIVGIDRYKGPVGQIFTGTIQQLNDLIEKASHQ